MTAAKHAVDVDRYVDFELEEEAPPERPRERFRMTYSPLYRSSRNSTPKAVNGIHRRRRKKVLH